MNLTNEILDLYKNIDNKLIIIKRDGREEPFQLMKMYKVITWATQDQDTLTYILLKDLRMKIEENAKIKNIYDHLIHIAASKISAIGHAWDEVAKRLLLLKIYKEEFNLKRTGNYYSFNKFLSEGVKYGIYDEKIVNLFDEDEIDELGSYIDPNRDLIFNYKGLSLFVSKYCKEKYVEKKKRKLELPQITYMVAAMDAFAFEPANTREEKKRRLKLIQTEYDNLSLHRITYSTPRISFGMGTNRQMASCVLIHVGDSIEAINWADMVAGVYSSFAGGISMCYNDVRTRGSTIRTNKGKSDGPIPFIKRNEQTVSSYNQSGQRKGSVSIYFQWWNNDVMDLLVLKDEGGAEDMRARKCKYGFIINRIFLERVKNDGYITLFDPKEVPDLGWLSGDEFEKRYLEYEKNAGSLTTKTIKAREVMFELLRVRTETGNIYIFFSDNVNEQNVTNRFVTMSNLCAEITVPARPPKTSKETYITTEDGTKQVITTREGGEVGLCNLSCVNLFKFQELESEQKNKLISSLLRGMDNIIDSQFYPVKEGEISNKTYRPIGIGFNDVANLLAANGLKFSDPSSYQFMNDVMDDFYYRIYKESVELAKERGTFVGFKNSNWAKGLTPFHLSIFRRNNPLGLKYNTEKWDDLAEEIRKYGVRFSLHSTCPPSACAAIYSPILTKDGVKTMEQFLIEDCKITKEEIEEIVTRDVPIWIELKEPVTVPTRYGDKEITRIYYNGRKQTRTIVMEDGTELTYTHNHPVLTQDGWKTVGELTEDDEILEFGQD